MKVTNKIIVPREEEIRTEAIKVIIEKLGMGKAAFFLRNTMSSKADYLKIKEKLFGGKTSEKLYSEIKKWKGNNS